VVAGRPGERLGGEPGGHPELPPEHQLEGVAEGPHVLLVGDEAIVKGEEGAWGYSRTKRLQVRQTTR
jgi:hypothetical protein